MVLQGLLLREPSYYAHTLNKGGEMRALLKMFALAVACAAAGSLTTRVAHTQAASCLVTTS